ncbi:hypothetical protein ACJZ2D_010777 [Fusarium nematophilum]
MEILNPISRGSGRPDQPGGHYLNRHGNSRQYVMALPCPAEFNHTMLTYSAAVLGNLDDSSPSSDSSSSGNAWIAGAVIGPVAFLALLVAGVIFLWRRRKRAGLGQQLQPDRDEPGTKAELEGSQGNMIAGVLGAAWQKPELDDGQRGVQEPEGWNGSTTSPTELRGSQVGHLPELSPDATVYELDTSSRGPHELAPDAFQKSELEGPPSAKEAHG